MSYARKVDSTHKAVVEAFRAAGWHVCATFRLPHCPDAFVAKAGRTVAVEIKGPKTRISAQQSAWHADWPGETAIIRSPEDVLELSRA